MGRQYAYFAAKDDQVAIAAFESSAGWPPFTSFSEEIRLDDLDYIENLLTGRSVQEIRADPRFNAGIAEQIDEHAGVVECGVMTVTDTFTRALAGADLNTLPDEYRDYVVPLRDLAVVARQAASHGHHMYCLWLV
jgi:hypothetical protein